MLIGFFFFPFFFSLLTTLYVTLNFIDRGKGDYQMDFEPAPRITEADKKNDKKYEADLLRIDFFPFFPSNRA